MYLYGADSYRRTKKLSEIIQLNKAKQPNADLFFADLSEDADAWRDAKDFLDQPSMFSPSKTLVVRESGEVDEKAWIKLLKEHAATPKTFIIISDSCAKPKKAFSFLLEAPVKTQEFASMEGKILETFLKKEADAHKLTFEKDAWNYFVKFVDSKNDNTWVGARELEKISCAQFNAPITKKELETLVRFSQGANVFDSSRALMARGTPYARAAVLESLLLQGEEAPRLFNLLAYNARGAQAVRLADLDIAIKSGTSDYEEALLDFVLFNQ